MQRSIVGIAIGFVVVALVAQMGACPAYVQACKGTSDCPAGTVCQQGTDATSGACVAGEGEGEGVGEGEGAPGEGEGEGSPGEGEGEGGGPEVVILSTSPTVVPINVGFAIDVRNTTGAGCTVTVAGDLNPYTTDSVELQTAALPNPTGPQTLTVNCGGTISDPYVVTGWSVTPAASGDGAGPPSTVTVSWGAVGVSPANVHCEATVAFLSNNSPPATPTIPTLTDNTQSTFSLSESAHVFLSCFDVDEPTLKSPLQSVDIDVPVGVPTVVSDDVTDGPPTYHVTAHSDGADKCFFVDGNTGAPLAPGTTFPRLAGGNIDLTIDTNTIADGDNVAVAVACSDANGNVVNQQSDFVRVHAGDVADDTFELTDGTAQIQLGNILVSSQALASMSLLKTRLIGGEFSIDCAGNTSNLDSVSLPSLEKATGTLAITRCDKPFFGIDIGSQATAVDLGGLSITNEVGSNVLGSISLPKMAEINGDLVITGDSSLASISMPALTRVGGTLDISTNAALGLVTFDGLDVVGGTFQMISDSALDCINAIKPLICALSGDPGGGIAVTLDKASCSLGNSRSTICP